MRAGTAGARRPWKIASFPSRDGAYGAALLARLLGGKVPDARVRYLT
jgi:hypothetical protein